MRRGSHVPDELRARLSAANTGKHPSIETRAKMSATRMGHPVSGETRAKMRAANGNPSLETRAKLSAAGMGRKGWNKGIPMSETVRGAIFSIETIAKSAASRWKGGLRANQSRHDAKCRGLGWFPLNSWFLGCDRHHVNKELIIHMPRKLHRGKGNYHNHNTGKGMARINAIAYNFLFKQEVEAALGVA